MTQAVATRATRLENKDKKPKTVSRRVPQQTRSQSMVDAILSAAKMLVVKHGVDGLTTNGVARLAGVSIGSLYQYFPGKRAILTELRKRHQEVGEQIFLAEARVLFHAPVEVATRRFVEKMIEVHSAEPALHRALELEARAPGYGEWERRAVELVRVYYEQHKNELGVKDLEQAAFVVSVVTEALTHAAVLERPEFLRDGRFVDDVVRMLLAYLLPR